MVFQVEIEEKHNRALSLEEMPGNSFNQEDILYLFL